MSRMYKYVTLLNLLIINTCNHQHPTPYENQSFSWELVKRFERNNTIQNLFIREPNAWAGAHETDYSVGIPPKVTYYLFSTSNNWETYRKLQTPVTNADLKTIYFLTQERGWVITDNGRLYQTEDSGDSWKRIDLGSSLHGTVFFYNDQEGIVTGNPDYETKDGGQTWTPVTTRYPNNLRISPDIRYISPDTAFAMGSSDLPASSGIYKTTDGGKTWELVFHDNSSMGYIVSYATLDGVHFWYLNGKVLYYSADGAKTWTIQDYYVHGSVIKLYPDGKGLILAKDTIWRTSDGGFTWRKQEISRPTATIGFSAIRIYSPENIWGWGQNVIVRLSGF